MSDHSGAAVQHVPLLNIIRHDQAEDEDNVRQVLAYMDGLDLPAYQPPADESDWILRHKAALGPAPEQWMPLCRQFRDNVQRLTCTRDHPVFHVFFKGPAALALAMGATLGTRHPLRLHHRQAGAYHPVMDFSTGAALMRLKRRLDGDYDYLTVREPACWTADTVVALRLIAASPASFVSAILDEKQTAMVVVDNRYEDVLTWDMDWAQVAHEAADVVRKTLNQVPVRQVHLSFGCPVVLAFALGMALDFKSAVRVYHWFAEQEAYQPVAQLNKLRAPATAQDEALVSIFDSLKQARMGGFEWLHKTLDRLFNKDELKTLCTYVDVDYEDLGVEGKTGMIRELILYLDRRDRLPDLLAQARALRPNAPWEEMPA